jgi:hypothetical protein
LSTLSALSIARPLRTRAKDLRDRVVEEAIASAIAYDLGVSEDDTRTQLVAASLTAAFNLLADRGAAKARPWTPEEAAAQIDPVFTFCAASSMHSSNHAPHVPAEAFSGRKAALVLRGCDNFETATGSFAN